MNADKPTCPIVKTGLREELTKTTVILTNRDISRVLSRHSSDMNGDEHAKEWEITENKSSVHVEHVVYGLFIAIYTEPEFCPLSVMSSGRL